MSQVQSANVSSVSTLGEAIAAHNAGTMSQPELLQWCCENQFDVSQVALLLGIFDALTFGNIMKAQTELARAQGRSEVSRGGNITWKVSKKGAISIYGLNTQMPITLYAGQVKRFLTEEIVKGLLSLAHDKEVSSSYCLADYIFAKSKGSFENDLSAASDIKWMKDWTAGKFPHVRFFTVQGEEVPRDDIANCLNEAKKFGGYKDKDEDFTSQRDKNALKAVLAKCERIKAVAKLSQE